MVGMFLQLVVKFVCCWNDKNVSLSQFQDISNIKLPNHWVVDHYRYTSHSIPASKEEVFALNLVKISVSLVDECSGQILGVLQWSTNSAEALPLGGVRWLGFKRLPMVVVDCSFKKSH